MSYALTQEDEKLLFDIQQAFVIETSMVNAIYHTPAQSLRMAADRLDREESLAARFALLLQRISAAPKP